MKLNDEYYDSIDVYDEQANATSYGNSDIPNWLEDKEFTELISNSRKSNWRPKDKRYRDSITVYQFDEGFAVYEYICGGYSSYTFEPTRSITIMITQSFDIFYRLGLTDSQRNYLQGKLNHLRTEAGGLLYGR